MTKRTSLLTSAFLVVASAGFPPPGYAGTVILKKAWVEKFKNLTTIQARMKVHHAHVKPNKIGKGSEDGDLHFSGTAEQEIGLPFVAEIVNAKAQTKAQDAVHKAEREGDAVSVTGAWRIWFEHPAAKQTQGGKNAFAPDTTNPDHLFEIHPISKIEAEDVHGSFVAIPGFTAYDAGTAFPYFDGLKVTIQATNSAITMESKKSKYNYVQFYIELTAKPKKVGDGYIALANVVDSKGEAVTDGPRRMIFVEGTKGATAIKDSGEGDTLHVLGIPRFNLDGISHLVKKNGTSQFEAQLPYEMIIVGVYPE